MNQRRNSGGIEYFNETKIFNRKTVNGSENTSNDAIFLFDWLENEVMLSGVTSRIGEKSYDTRC